MYLDFIYERKPVISIKGNSRENMTKQKSMDQHMSMHYEQASRPQKSHLNKSININ